MNTAPLLAPLVVRHGSFALAMAHARGARILRTAKAGRDSADLLRLVSNDLLRAGARAIDGFPETDVPIALDEIGTALRFAANRHWGVAQVLGLHDVPFGHTRFGDEWLRPAHLAAGRFAVARSDDVFYLLVMIAATVWARGAEWWCAAGHHRIERDAPRRDLALVAEIVRSGELELVSVGDLDPIAEALCVLTEGGAPPTLLAAYALAGPCPRRDRLRRLCREIDGTAAVDPTYDLG